MMDIFSMKKFFYTVLSLAVLWGCAPSGQQFEVEGKVSGADGKMLLSGSCFLGWNSRD
jgi:hypothetical protein